MSERIIIDTDPGVDDALAILMALGAPELEVEAITTVFGNVDVASTTRNALIILEVAGRTGIPVYSGAARPISRDGCSRPMSIWSRRSTWPFVCSCPKRV